MSVLGSLRTWLLFNNKIIPHKYNLPNNSALPVKFQRKSCCFYTGTYITVSDSLRNQPLTCLSLLWEISLVTFE